MFKAAFQSIAIGALGLCLVHCSSAGSQPSGNPAGACGTATIERFKELEIVDPAVIDDARSNNTADGPWSFRYLIEHIAPEGSNLSDFVLTWLTNWVNTKQINGFATDIESRVDGMNQHLICPWLQATPSNGCDDKCNCTSKVLDLSKAPFRLMAIANRIDLGGRPGIASKLGEMRFVFMLTRGPDNKFGPADDPTSVPAPMSMIFEYMVPETTTQKEWAKRWHHLATHADFDESFRVELQAITDSITARNAAPDRVNGSALSQLRTNESAFDWIWQLRQFNLDPSGQLVLSPVVNTPGSTLNNSPTLRDWVVANREAIIADKHLIPPSLLAGSADQLLFKWNVPGVDETLRAAFAKGTCNGCHSEGENPSIDTAFHVSPFQKGVARLSPFVNNPLDPAHDDLGRRENVMRCAMQ